MSLSSNVTSFENVSMRNYCCYIENISPLLLQFSISLHRPYNTLGIGPCGIYEICNAFFSENCLCLIATRHTYIIFISIYPDL